MYKCNICGARRELVKAGDLVLCGKCIGVIHRVLKPKIRAKLREKPAKAAKTAVKR